MRKALVRLLQENYAAAVGILGYETIKSLHTSDAVARAEALVPGFRSLIVAAFSYARPEMPPAGVSMYAAAPDYHRVLEKYLMPAVETLRGAGFMAQAMADISPFDERACAFAAGLGLRGENGLLIVPGYGSYVFIGTILTDAALAEEDDAQAVQPCEKCGACRAVCPYGALGERFEIDQCLSELSQRRQLDERQLTILRETGTIWGCDRCQAVCPHNQGVKISEIPEFRTNLLTDADIAEMAMLSNREFKEKFGGYALAWRGAGVLRRNIANLEKK